MSYAKFCKCLRTLLVSAGDGVEVAAGMTVSSPRRVLPTAGDRDAQAIGSWVGRSGREANPCGGPSSHVSQLCPTFARQSAGRVKEDVVRYIVKRNTGNDIEWSAMHGASSTSGVTKQRRVLVEGGRRGVGVSGSRPVSASS